MSEFEAYIPRVPDRISSVSITVSSVLVPDVDEFNEPTGTYTEMERIQAEAVVLDENGDVVEHHMTTNPQILINNNIFTAQQLSTIQAWIQAVRDNAELVLMP